MRWVPHTLLTVSFLFALAGTAAAGDATVWLKADVKSPQGRADIRLPLEWLASTRTAEEPTLRVSGVRIDCVEMWNAHKGLAAGESLLVQEGVTGENERYLIRVVSAVSVPAASGKVRILSRDENGKETEVGFPLAFAKVLDGLSSVIPHWLDDDDRVEVDGERFSLTGDVEFARLADYGPFTVLDARDAKSRVRIWIE